LSDDVQVQDGGPVEEDLFPYTDADDAGDLSRAERTTPVPYDKFLYIGKGLTASEFTNYVNGYNFGSKPPDYVVLHHTGIPFLMNARAAGDNIAGAWDNDAGMSDEARYNRRLQKVHNMREYYRTNPGLLWDRGPHLFVDERYIWLFTPMYHPGIHAKQGNQYTDDSGRLRYSVGIEVIGNYTNTRWSEPVAKLVGHAVATLQKRLQNFEIRYKPGPRSAQKNVARDHNPWTHVNSVCSHRDFNKAACPGNSITEEYYIQVIQSVM
jgi:hypothetical protein